MMFTNDIKVYIVANIEGYMNPRAIVKNTKFGTKKELGIGQHLALVDDDGVTKFFVISDIQATPIQDNFELTLTIFDCQKVHNSRFKDEETLYKEVYKEIEKKFRTRCEHNWLQVEGSMNKETSSMTVYCSKCLETRKVLVK
jgi:hypothetical protein